MNAQWSLQRAPGAAPVFPSPRPVTRGESTPNALEAVPEVPAFQVSKIDWLNCTFDRPAMSVPGLVSFLGTLCNRAMSAKLEGGLLGFEQRHRLFVHLDDGSKSEIGALALGGEAQKGRWLLQFTGHGCSMVQDWESLHELLEGLGAKITRLDVALDFLEGEKTVDDAMDMLEAGLFTSKGRTPSSNIAGQWFGKNTAGRTLYVGKSKNGKMLRCYEKGKQLGDAESQWTRYEVQLGNRDREIPLDALLHPDRYFVGAYPALEALIDEVPAPIPTTRNEAKISLGHLLYHMKRCYGKALHQVTETTAATHLDLVEEIRIVGVPRRLKPAGVDSGLAWPELQAQLRNYENG